MYRDHHGHTVGGKFSPTYTTWHKMVQRCTNPNDTNYHKYGGRRIVVCDRWLYFTNFLADMGERPTGLQLDRIDNNQGYYPGNCRWVTIQQNAQNTRRCVTNEVQVKEIKKELREALKDGKLPHGTLSRLAQKFSLPAHAIKTINSEQAWKGVV
jgi:hypothetical protein